MVQTCCDLAGQPDSWQAVYLSLNGPPEHKTLGTSAREESNLKQQTWRHCSYRNIYAGEESYRLSVSHSPTQKQGETYGKATTNASRKNYTHTRTYMYIHITVRQVPTVVIALSEPSCGVVVVGEVVALP